MGKNITLILLLLISLIPGYGNAHHPPTEATPEVEIRRQHPYPSDVIYGFVEGCYLAFEDERFMADQLWPTDLKEICGCVMDSIRETVPLQEFIKDWNGKLTPEQNAMSEMFGVICTEQIIKEKLKIKRVQYNGLNIVAN